MGRLHTLLDESAVAGLLAIVERGESLTNADVSKALTLQALQSVRIGELFVLDIIESESKMNDDLKSLIDEFTS